MRGFVFLLGLDTWSLLIFFLTQHTLFAQQDITLYNMEVVPQRMYDNPAFKPSYSRVNIGLPLISSQYVNFSHSGFKYSDLIRHRADDSLYADVENMLSKLARKNYISVAYRTDLLSFGFQVKKNYFSFNATEKVDFRFRYPKKFMEFIWKGNGALLGEDINLNFGVDITHYREYGFGYAREINAQLTIGGKLKYLYGMENIRTEKSDITLYTDPNYFSITAKSNVIINTSGWDNNSFDNFSVGDYVFKKKNKGAGIDLGGVYKYNAQFTFSASVIDLGFIRWKDATTNYQSNNPKGEFTYHGIDVSEFINGDTINLAEAFTAIGDSLSEALSINTVHHSYTTMLSTQIYLGANYSVTEKSNAGFLFYSQVFDKTIHPGIALSYNQRLGRWLCASVSYSIYNRSYNNVGLGLSLNLGPIQWYMVSDNIMGAIFPQHAKNAHLHFGLNLTFGRSLPDKDKDKIPDKKDACPDIPGIKEFNGCPDKDGDHIPDQTDECPDNPGLPKFNGCPDRDGDDIIDKNDSCSDVVGIAELNGCPDRDSDKITDRRDSCPDDPGLPEFNGCPDRDGDEITDKEDRCPAQAGPKENDGCPYAKLYWLDKAGNIVATAIVGKDGKFTFTELPMDENVLLRLESYDVLIPNEFTVVTGTSVRVARKGIDGYFHFEILPADKNKMGTLDITDVQIKLKAEEARTVKKAMETLEFDFGSDIIRSFSTDGLDLVAELLQHNPAWRLKLSGHTDNVSSMKFNMELSKKRVESIKKYLVNKKRVEADRIVLKWYGPAKPIASNDTEEGRQKNRRVEFLIIE